MARRVNRTGRSTGLSRKQLDGFTQIPNYVLRSEAMRTASPAAVKVCLYLAARCFGAKHNGQIVFAIRSGCLLLNLATQRWEEQSIGLSPSRTAEALQELEERGFIVCTKDSTFNQKRRAKEYRLTWMRTEQDIPTNDFLNWKATEKKQDPVHPAGL